MQAKFYDYVESAGVVRVQPYGFGRTLAIHHGGQIRTCGYKGSVVHLFRPDEYDKVLSLYKFLQNMCRDHHICLMSYQRVIIGNPDWSNWLVVTFNHDRASNVYFTKMYMEAVCG